MDLDVPRAERRRRLEGALAVTGVDASALDALRVEDAQVLSRARLRWTVPARTVAAGDAPSALHVDLLMDPRRKGLVQSLDVTAR